MITLQEIFNTLAYGELSNMNLRQSHTDTLSEEQIPKVVSHINIGLNELYTRFNLYQDELTLHQHADTSIYYLREERAGDALEMDSEFYIEESFDTPFQNNLIKVLQAFNSLGEELPINDTNADEPIIAVSFDTLRMAFKEAQVISLVYQATYPKIVVTPSFNPSTYKLNIPEFIVEALLFKVASRVYKPMGTNSSTQDSDKSTNYLQMYELACAKIDALGLDTQINDAAQNFTRNGWL